MDTITIAVDAASKGLGVAELSAIVMGLLIVVQTIVRLTPTKKDDEILNPVFRVLSAIFNKTNTKDELKQKIKTTILEETVSTLSEKNPEVAHVVRSVSDRIIKEANLESEEKGSGTLDGVTTNTEVSAELRRSVRKTIENANPKTKTGKGLKALLLRRSQWG